MTNVLANLARMTSATVGVGTLTLGGAVAGCNTFDDAGVLNGSVVTYYIEDYDGTGAIVAREIGVGTYTTATKTLTRTTVYASSSGGTKIFCSGRQHVGITPAKEDFDTLLESAVAASTYLTIASAAASYQPLDADLTALAANITAFGHSLVDDANAAAARATLGLGTAATQNTGTSGANIPFLNGANTWSGQQIIDLSATSPLANGLVVQSSENSASAGPGVLVRRISASPAANDQIGFFQFQGRDSAGNNTIYGSLTAVIVDPTDGSEDGGFQMFASIAGSVVGVAKFVAGAVVGTPTGDDKGFGTLNATTLYENGTSLASKYGALASANVWTAAQTVRIDNATTNAVTQAARLSHTTTGTPAVGIGVGLEFEAETSGGNNEVGATIEVVATDVGSATEDFDFVVKVMTNGAAATEKFRIKSTGSILHGTAALATNATDGFLYVPTCAGTPTGVPTSHTGQAPLVVDTTNNKLYFYSGGAWRDAGP